MHQAFLAVHAQQKPFLLLADAHRVPAAPDQAAGQAVAQPVVGHTQKTDMLGLQAQFLFQLAVQGLLGCFVALDAALRELPSVLADALGPENLGGGIGQDDADVGTKPIRVNHLLYDSYKSVLEMISFHSRDAGSGKLMHMASQAPRLVCHPQAPGQRYVIPDKRRAIHGPDCCN